jgi:hypothetical protein
MSEYEIGCIESEIIKRLDKGETVYIESGAANDCITGYSVRKYKTHSWQSYEEKETTFTTTACIFPEKIMLSNWDNVDTEEFEGKLFVHVW